MNRKHRFRSNEFRLRNSAPVAGRICDTILLRHSAIDPPEGLMNRKHRFRFIKKGAAITGYTLLLKKIAKERTPVLSPTFIS